MINETLQDRAVLYVAGGLTAREREDFELILEFHDELRALVREFSEVAVGLLALAPIEAPEPSSAVKDRILAELDLQARETAADSFVVSGPDGRVQWVNAAFSKMCGYTLEELRGKKLGPILQGEKTDPEAAARMRASVFEHRPCRETLVNYHKDGTAYWVDIGITPMVDDADRVLYLVARERELSEPATI